MLDNSPHSAIQPEKIDISITVKMTSMMKHARKNHHISDRAARPEKSAYFSIHMRTDALKSILDPVIKYMGQELHGRARQATGFVNVAFATIPP